MLASNSNQIPPFPFMNYQIHDEIENPIISRFELQNYNHPPSLQLIDCYNNYNFNPFLDEEFILGHILYSQKQQFLGPEIGLGINAKNTNEETTTKTTTTTQKKSSQKKAKTDQTSTKIPISRRRNSTKDRHSKICTSKGPRDRRMRLSLEIARNFFDLQDMLGFDKASKTVEWLFTKSRSAIKELKEKYLLEPNYCNNNNYGIKNWNNSTTISSIEEVSRGKKRRKLRIVDKESRFKARARARERTRAKLVRGLEKSKSDFEGNPDGICKVGDVIEESGTKSKIVEYQQTCVSHSENGKILGSKGENSACSICNKCENKVVSKEKCSEEVQFSGSSMDMGTVSLDSMKASPAGLKLLELDEIDGVLIFYGE